MKMNKKQLIIWGVVVMVLILGGLAFYNYSPSSNVNIENTQDSIDSVGEVNQENNPSDSVNPVQVEGVGVESVNNGNQGGLEVCVYKCGDGVCQNSVDCKPGTLNCICTENVAECPEDCSN